MDNEIMLTSRNVKTMKKILNEQFLICSQLGAQGKGLCFKIKGYDICFHISFKDHFTVIAKINDEIQYFTAAGSWVPYDLATDWIIERFRFYLKNKIKKN